MHCDWRIDVHVLLLRGSYEPRRQRSLCVLVDDRFTVVSLDAYTGDYVEVRLYGARGMELAQESLYEDD